MMKFLNDQRLVSFTPIATSLIFEVANIGQLIEMYRSKSAEGQSIFSWCVITLALILWFNFYRIKTPDEKLAIWSTVIAIAMNFVLIGTVIYYKLP